MLKNKILFPALLATLALCGCSEVPQEGGQGSDSDQVSVTFNSNLGTSSTFELKLDKGESVDDVLTSEVKSSIDVLTVGDVNNVFEGWYVSLDGAENLLESDYFDFSTKIDANLELFAGYTDTTINQEVVDFVSGYLGIYEDFNVDPFPLMEAKDFATDNDNGNAFTYFNVTSHSYEKYLSSLTDYYDFTEVSEGNYLSKTGAYTLALDYDSSSQDLKVKLAFNDEEGKFPTYFFASNFYGVDMSYYISSKNFNLADDAGVSADKRYITYSGIGGDGVRNNYIFYTPNHNYYDSLKELKSFLEDANITLDTTSEEGYLTDVYNSAYVEVGYVTDTELQAFPDLGLSEDMIMIRTMPNGDRSTLDTDLLTQAINYYLDQPDEEIPMEIEAEAYSAILLTSSSNTYLPMYMAFGVKPSTLDELCETYKAEGWHVSVTGSSYKSISLYSPSFRYRVSIMYYPASYYADTNTSVAQVVFARYANAFDTINALIEEQSNNGECGAKITLPEFSAENFKVEQSETETATYFVTGFDSTLDEFKAYVKALKDMNVWTVNSEDTYDLSLTSNDGYYELSAEYRGGNIKLTFTYLTDKVVDTLDEAQELVKARVGFIMNSNVASSVYEEGMKLTVMQYFDGTYNRAIIAYSFDKLDEVNEAYDTMISKMDENLTYLSASSGVSFYQGGSLIYYAYKSETSTGYTLSLVAYSMTK